MPDTEQDAYRQLRAARSALRSDARSQEVCRLLLAQPARFPGGEAAQRFLIQAAIDLLPPWARQMHGLRASGPMIPLVHIGTYGMAGAIRWTFRP